MGVIVVRAAYAGLLVSSGKPLKCSHRMLYTYLVVLTASFVSMVRLDEIMSYKSRFFAMVAAALLVVSLPSAGYAAGQTEEDLARQIQAYVPGVGVDDILAGARGRLSQDRMCVLCL